MEEIDSENLMEARSGETNSQKHHSSTSETQVNVSDERFVKNLLDRNCYTIKLITI